MKYIKKILAALCCAAMLGCTNANSGSNSSGSSDTIEYSMYTGADNYPTRLTLQENNKTFQIVINNKKNVPYGHYTIEDDVMTMKTLDGEYVFRFTVVDDTELDFIADGSSAVFSDGAVFLRNDVYEKKYSTSTDSSSDSSGEGSN